MATEGVSEGRAVSDSKFTGLMWSGVAISACFVSFRIFLRIRGFRKLFADDALVLTAWFMLLARSIILQIDRGLLYLQWAADKQEYLPHMASTVATSVLFLTGLWAVKLSFLIFFRRLGQNVSGQKYLWWSITGFTVISGITCLVIPWWKCLQEPGGEDHVCPARHATNYQRVALLVGTSLDVISDALIMILPFTLLWNVQISWRQKLALGGVFSVTVFVIVFAIVRANVADLNKSQADETQLYLWSNAEMAMAILVACVSPFRQLCVKQDNGSAQARPVADRARRFLRGVLDYIRMKTKTSFSDDIVIGDRNQSPGWRPATARNSSIDPMVPLNCIHMRHDIVVSSETLCNEEQSAKTTVIKRHDLPPDIP